MEFKHELSDKEMELLKSNQLAEEDVVYKYLNNIMDIYKNNFDLNVKIILLFKGSNVDVIELHMHEILADYYDKLELIEMMDDLVEELIKCRSKESK